MNTKVVSNTFPSKLGRKPKGERTLTAAEHKRASRSRLADDSVEIMLRLSAGTNNIIDQFARSQNVTRSQVAELFFDFAIARISDSVARAERLLEQGGSEDALAQLIRNSLHYTTPTDTLEKYKEVLGIK